MSQSRSETLFANAQKHIPGGVNSPVRAFKSVGGTPLFFKHAEGAYVIDEDDKRYVDYVGSWGPTAWPVATLVATASSSSRAATTATPTAYWSRPARAH